MVGVVVAVVVVEVGIDSCVMVDVDSCWEGCQCVCVCAYECLWVPECKWIDSAFVCVYV